MIIEEFEKKPAKIIPYVLGVFAIGGYIIGGFATKSWDPSVQIKKFLNNAGEIRWESEQRRYLMGALDVAIDKDGSGKFEADEKEIRDAYLKRIKKENPSLRELEDIVRNYK